MIGKEPDVRAMIVDDSRALRKILGEMLRQAGVTVIEAANGREALKKLSDTPRPDVALIDWNMPEMNGLELVVALRASEEFATLPIIMVTTETEIEQMSVALAAGANEYVMKPFSADVILDKMRILNVFECADA